MDSLHRWHSGDLKPAGRCAALQFQLVTVHRLSGDERFHALPCHPTAEPFGGEHYRSGHGVEWQLMVFRKRPNGGLDFVAKFRGNPASDAVFVSVYHIGVVLVLSDERSFRPEAAYILGLRSEKLP